MEGEMKKIKISRRYFNNHMRRFDNVLTHLFGSIKAKLILAFLLPIAFIIILGYTSYAISSKAIKESFTSSTVNLITSTGSYYDVVMQNIRGKALELSTDYEIKGYYDGEYAVDPEAEVQKGVKKLSEDEVYKNISTKTSVLAMSDKYIENVIIFTDYGYPTSTNGSFKDATPYATFKKTEEASKIKLDTWTGYHQFLDEQLGIDKSKYAIALTKQYINGSSKKTGYVVLDVSMNIVTDALASLDLPAGSIVAYISPDGREITSAGNSKAEVFVDQTYYNQTLANEGTTYSSTITYQGKKQLFISSKVGETGALVAALVPYSKITEKADYIKIWAAIIIVISAIFAGSIGVIVASGIGKNIKNIIDNLSKAAAGDLTVTINTKRKDEFKVLTNSINHMIVNVKKLIKEASAVGETVYISSQNVTESSEMLLTASKDIARSVAEIQQGIIQQASDAEMCLHQTDSLTSQINLVYDNSVAIEKITTNTKNIVTDGITEIDQLNEATKANIKITNDTINNIEELELESNAITEIIAVINDIAEQTNLLSLNASIEAARAGEAGRGFAVVADEIRKLAVKSMHSATEIEKIINKINTKTQLTVGTVKQAGDISKKTESRLLNVIQLFNNINIHVDDLANKMGRIAEGINDIDLAKNDTLKAIESISAVAEETSAASLEVEATAGQQIDAVTKLNEASKILNSNSDDLMSAIQLFKIE